MMKEQPNSTADKLRALVLPTAHQPWNEWFKVRELAKKLRISQDEVLSLVDEDEALMLNTGFGCGNGTSSIAHKGDYLVEYFGS